MFAGHHVIVTFDRDLSSADICNVNWLTKVSQSSALHAITGLLNIADRTESSLPTTVHYHPAGRVFTSYISGECLLWSNKHKYITTYSCYGAASGGVLVMLLGV